jgi:uncharacterized repeat protein (TIGR03803 family)
MADGSLSRTTLELDQVHEYLYGTLSSGGPNNSGSIFVSTLTGQILNVIPFGGDWGADPIGKLTIPSTRSTGGTRPRLQPEATTNVDLSAITLYGVTASGGSNNCGTVYRVQANGSNFMALHTFSYSTTDGSYPQGGMVLQSNMVYGATSSGGMNYAGTVFKVDTNGNNFQIIGNFNSGTTGGSPQGNLIRAGNTLYGTTYGGGTNGGGTVYSISTDGSDFQVLYSFSTPTADPSGYYTNSDITPTNESYQVSWPLYPGGYALQQSFSLTSSNWNTVNAPLTTNGLLVVAAIAPPKGNTFFRLVTTNSP